MPRHPPCALHSLSHTPPTQPQPPIQQLVPGRRCTQHATKEPHTPPTINTRHREMCAYKQKETHPTHQTPAHPHKQTHGDRYGSTGASQDARVHYPDLKQQPHTHTHTPHGAPAQARHRSRSPRTPPPPAPNRDRTRVDGLILQNPNSVSSMFHS
jgi:hypothetical protein